MQGYNWILSRLFFEENYWTPPDGQKLLGLGESKHIRPCLDRGMYSRMYGGWLAKVSGKTGEGCMRKETEGAR